MTQVARGTSYTWTGIFRNAADALVDCADVTLTIADPDGDVLTGFPVALPAVVRVSLGTYTYAWAVPSAADLGRYDADWAGTGDIDGLAYGGSDSVEVVEEGSVTPHVTPVDDVRALVSTTLTDVQLGDVIGREESWLARRIGPLIGERTQRFYPDDSESILRLRRPTDAVTVDDNGTVVTAIEMRRLGFGVARTSGTWTDGPVDITYTPNDADEVRSAIIELVEIRLTESGYQSERIGEYSYTRSDRPRSRISVVRDLLEPQRPTSIRIPTTAREPASDIIGVIVS
jgi:hypothetical protein